jgi:uncharacterized radical SAM superfamily Fe-S cluster-containing enzyme
MGATEYVTVLVKMKPHHLRTHQGYLKSGAHCSLGTYLFVDQNRKAVPVTQFVDVGPMLREMDTLARKAGKRCIQFFAKCVASR